MEGSTTMCALQVGMEESTSQQQRHQVSISHPAFHTPSSSSSSSSPTSHPALCRPSSPSHSPSHAAPHTLHHGNHHHITRSHPLSISAMLPLLVLFMSALITASSAQLTCTNSAGCFPPEGNLALGRTIMASSTCSDGVKFCPLFLFTDCDVCEAGTAHSAESLNDDDDSTFWVSEIGTNVSEVSLSLDFEAPVLFQGTTLLWKSTRPVAMTLERSCDYGETWSVYRYYALSCSLSFMMEDTYEADPSLGTTPICTSRQTELFSFDFTDAVITFSTSEHTPLNDEEAACYESITNLRVVMFDLFPEVRISNSSFQFYSVREWMIQGSCTCNGHADTCVPRPGEEVLDGVEKVYAGCMCQHNTASTNCEECLSGFNNAPYLPGTATEANVCEACMCSGHAVDCRYDTLQSSAVCLNCTDNTIGNQCDECAQGFYQDLGQLLNHPDICLACDCDPAGITDEEGVCDSRGQCSCKANVESATCGECQDGYFNMTASNPDGCQLCSCIPSGSELNEQGLPRCDEDTGVCVCLETVQGEQCGLCQPGNYDISSGCPPCDCNLGGATSEVCDPSGQCPCKPNVEGALCTAPMPGYYFLTLDAFIFEAEDIAIVLFPGTELVLPVDGRYGSFTGQGFVSLPADVSIAFLFSPPRDSQYEVILRFSSMITATSSISFTLSSVTPVSTSLNCSDSSPSPALDTLTYDISVSSATLSQGYLTVDSVCLSRTSMYHLSFSYTSTSSTPLLVDSVVLLPDISATSTFYSSSDPALQQFMDSCLPRAASSASFGCEDISFTLSTEFLGDDPLLACDCDPDGTVAFNSSVCAAFGGGCAPCQPGVTGQQCDVCLNGFFGFSSDGCEACDCDAVGSLMSTCSDAGQCSCKPGVGGPTCADCLPDYFNFTSEGCSPCDCSEYTTSVSCNVTTGQCSCPEGVIGRTCDECMSGFFNLSTDGCQACDCDTSGSVDGSCDLLSGQCMCLGSLGGQRCDECDEGFFNTGGGVRETCEQCVCSGRTQECSLSGEEAQLMALQFNFSQLCSTDPLTCGDGWRVAAEGDSIETVFGPNDVNGLGYILTFNMMPMVILPEAFLGDRQSSYGFNFTALVTVVSTAALNRDDILVRLESSQSDTTLRGYPHVEAMTNGLEDSVFLTLTISFVETNWIYDDVPGRSPDLLEFLVFLTNLTQISFTADFTVDFIEFVYIRLVTLDYVPSSSSSSPPTSSSSISLPFTYPLEDCTCPAPYQGLSCEECARGYSRPSGSIGDPCVQCECNGQTPDCEVETGVCLNCTGNTIGDQCQECQEGFYGDPTRGIECLPCPCPLVGGSFSPTCFLEVGDGLPTCDGCLDGYTGRNCEICMDGFFGNPLIGRCTTCECNGNTDPALGPVCDMETGRCMNCQNNTDGFECEICQLGYFGDPGTDIPCRECDCDVRGNDQYCDPLFGTCICLPNVEGDRCDSCSAGFFNITQGVGCTECDCDPIGSTSNDCDQDSGMCSCLDNVGSSEDTKCEACTPGYFNFIPGVGCEACGCSELSVSEECDAITGLCQCQDGAIGSKCDDCDFGFTGQVPNCERCHDCYFQWYDIIGSFTDRADSLQSSMDDLITTHYNGHTEESLEQEIDGLRTQLDQVNLTLSAITLEEADVEEIEMILIEINATLLTFTQRVSNIEADLDGVEATLELLETYDGTTNMNNVLELEARLQQLNTTATTLSLAANQSLAQLARDQDVIRSAWNEISSLNSMAETALDDLVEGEYRLEVIQYMIENITLLHMALRSNLTILDMRANRLAQQLDRATARADILSLEVTAANSSLVMLLDEVEMRLEETLNLVSLVQVLNDSLRSLEEVADEAESSADYVMRAAQEALDQANSTLQNITETLNITASLSESLAEALRIAAAVNSITIPPLEFATMLADRITDSIVPDELVSGIVEDVESSRAIAEAALELARSANDAVNSALALVRQVEEDLRCTNATQIQVEELQAVVESMLIQAQTDIDLVDSLFSELEQVHMSAEVAYNATLALLEETSALGVTSRAEAYQLLSNATGLEMEALRYIDVIREAQSDLDELADTVSEAAEDASGFSEESQELSSKAEALLSDVTAISMDDIKSLLDAYQEELRASQALDERIIELTQEMEQLIEIFTTTQRELKQCYRTP